MTAWQALPPGAPAYRFAAADLQRLWVRLHAGDAEPWPADVRVQAAWALCHAGAFEQATQAGIDAGGSGMTVANKAQALQASYVETGEAARRAMLDEVAARAEAQIAADPGSPSAHYWLGFALARIGQGTAVTQALAQGLTGRARAALERAIALAPMHADAHLALGGYHAEIVDRLGSLLGRTQGASKEAGIQHFRHALRLNPGSPMAMIDAANGMMMLEGGTRVGEAQRLYVEAAACEPADAIEWLAVQRARTELGD